MNKTNPLYLEPINKIKATIEAFDTIIMLRHLNPDGDAVGSALGLGSFLQQLYPHKKILMDGALNDNYLNSIKRLPVAKQQDYLEALVIIADTANRERIDSQYWSTAKKIIKIDHHIDVDDYADINFVDPECIAAAEMTAELVFAYNTPVPYETALALFIGIITDSNRFMYAKTSKRTLEIAAQLTTSGLNLPQIYEELYTQSLKTFNLKVKIMHQMHVTPKGVGYITIRKRQLLKTKENHNKLKSFVNLFNHIKEVKIWMLAVYNPHDHNVKISIRSQRYDIEQVAVKYAGGGHKFAAGCRIPNYDMFHLVIKDLEKVIKAHDSRS